MKAHGWIQNRATVAAFLMEGEYTDVCTCYTFEVKGTNLETWELRIFGLTGKMGFSIIFRVRNQVPSTLEFEHFHQLL